MTTNNKLSDRAEFERGEKDHNEQNVRPKVESELSDKSGPPKACPAAAKFIGISMPEAWQDLQRRANHPLSLERQLREALAACEVELEAQRKRQSHYALSSGEIEWNWRMLWLLLWLVLIAIVCIAAM